MKILEEALNGVEGKMLTEQEAETLFELAKVAGQRGNIVEIGSFKGRSTICLAMGLKVSGSRFRVYAIDPHVTENSLPDFMRNITRAGVSENIIPINEESLKVQQPRIPWVSFLFIDGLHDPENAMADFEYWCPKVLYGGIVALHDTGTYIGPALVADKKMFRSSQFRNVQWVGNNFTFGEKCAACSGTESVRKALRAYPWRLITWKRRTRIFPG